MNTLKKLICGMSLAALLFTPALRAQCCEGSCNEGYAYENTQRACFISPTVALGLLAIASAVAIACMNRSGSSSGGGGGETAGLEGAVSHS